MAKKERVNFIDALKGFAIIMVVVGHVADGYLRGTEAHNAWWHLYNGIYTFHMPLFMMLSGYLYELAYFKKDRGSEKKRYGHLGKHILNLIFIYILFSLLYGFFKVAFIDIVKESITLADLSSIYRISIAPFWYLYILIIYYVVFALLRRLPQNLMLMLLLSVNLVASGIEMTMDFEIYRLLQYGIYFGIGIALSRGELLYTDKKLSIIAAVMSLFCMILLWNNPEGKYLYLIPYVNTLIALGIIPVIWNLFENIEALSKKDLLGKLGNPLLVLGRYTLEIYVMHIIFTSIVRIGLGGIGGKSGGLWIIPDIIIGVVISTGIPVFISFILKKLRIHHTIFTPFSDMITEDKDRRNVAILKFAGLAAGILMAVGAAIYLEAGRIIKEWGSEGYAAYIYSEKLAAPVVNVTKATIIGLFKDYMSQGVMVAVGVCLAVGILLLILRPLFAKKHIVCAIISGIIAIAGIVLITLGCINYRSGFKLDEYYGGEDFVGQNYMSPLSTQIKFPKKNRNLIYISVGTPKMDNIFQEFTGAPVKVRIEQENLAEKDRLYNGLEDLTNVLFRKGYQTAAIIPNGGMIPVVKSEDGQFVWDEYFRLDRFFYSHNTPAETFGFHSGISYVSNAKQRIYELNELSAADQPYILTLFVPTEEEAKDIVSYVNDSSEADKTVVAVAYEDDEDFGITYYNSVKGNVVFKNGDKLDSGETLYFDRVDAFPTTLAAMGIKNSVNIMGLGTNLFSDMSTLRMDYGDEEYAKNMARNSEYMNEKYDQELRVNLSGVIGEKYRLNVHVTDKSHMELEFIDHIGFLPEEVDHMEADVWQEKDKSDITTVELKKKPFKHIYTADFNRYNPDIETFSAAMYMVAEDGIRYPMYEVKNGKVENYVGDLVTYINSIRDRDYIIFMAARDDISAGVLPEEELALHKLGLKANYAELPRTGYYAIIDGNDVIEKWGKSIETEGETADGLKYYIKSQGHDDGNTSEIVIDGENYADERRGLSIVIYDREEERVVQSAWYDISLHYRYSHTEY